jgi:hypothetical protein
MVASTGKTGKGVQFQIAPIASPLSWVTIGNVKSMNKSGVKADEVDFSILSTTGGYRDFQQGFKDGGQITVDVHYDPTDATIVGTTGLLGYFNSGTKFNWGINFANAGWAKRLTGIGFVSNPGDLDINVDGVIMGSAIVRNTGASSLVASP